MSARLEKMQQPCDYIVSKALTKSTTLTLNSELVEVVKDLEPGPEMEHDEYAETQQQMEHDEFVCGKGIQAKVDLVEQKNGA